MTWALEQSPLAAELDRDKLAIAGHSQGGKLAFYVASRDARFDLVIGWDPQNGGGAPCFVAGSVGQNCNAWPVAPSCDRARMFEDPGMLQGRTGLERYLPGGSDLMAEPGVVVQTK